MANSNGYSWWDVPCHRESPTSVGRIGSENHGRGLTTQICRNVFCYRKESYFLLSGHASKGQRLLGDSSRNKGAVRCHFPPSPLNVSTQTSVETHVEPTLTNSFAISMLHSHVSLQAYSLRPDFMLQFPSHSIPVQTLLTLYMLPQYTSVDLAPPTQTVRISVGADHYDSKPVETLLTPYHHPHTLLRFFPLQ